MFIAKPGTASFWLYHESVEFLILIGWQTL